jgi:hypothetical protein
MNPLRGIGRISRPGKLGYFLDGIKFFIGAEGS